VISIHVERDHSAFSVVRDAYPGPDIVALDASTRRGPQALAIRNDGVGIAGAATSGDSAAAM
jgi:hypothetical protein